MTSFLPTFPETSVSLGSLFIRHDLFKPSVTVYLKAWFLWHVDTQQTEVANGVFHFVEPSGNLVGIRCNSIPQPGDYDFVGPLQLHEYPAVGAYQRITAEATGDRS